MPKIEPETVVIATDHHFTVDKEGRSALPRIIPSTYYDRYLRIFERVVILARAKRVESLDDAIPLSSRIRLRALPDITGPLAFAMSYPEIRRVVKEEYRPASSYILRVPGQVSMVVARDLIRRGHRFGVEVAGDPSVSLARGAIRHPVRPVYRVLYERQLAYQIANASGVAFVTAGNLQSRYPVAEGSFSTSYSSIDLREDAFRLSSRSHAEDKARHVVTVATLNQPYKGIDVLIDAVAECQGMGCEVAVTVVGDGTLRMDLERKVSASGVINFNFVGEVPAGLKVREYLDSGSVFVLPSRAEGLPRALIEAMARGLPCIGTNVGGVSELLATDDLVEAGNGHALAEAIMGMLSSPERMNRSGASNLSRSRQFHSDVLTKRRDEFYEIVRQWPSAEE